jgi:hypothetical protein
MDPTQAFLLECIHKLHLRISALETMVGNLTEHRHDEWGRIFCVGENGYIRALGSVPITPVSQANQSAQLACLDGQHQGQSASSLGQ